jgi:hypothetical protein
MARTSKLKIFIINLKSRLECQLHLQPGNNKNRRSYRFKEKKYSLISKFGPANLA